MNILSGEDVLGTEKRLLTADEKDIAYETFIVVLVTFAAAVTVPPWVQGADVAEQHRQGKYFIEFY